MTKQIIRTQNASNSALFSQAIKVGSTIYVSGIVGIDPGTNLLAGLTIQEQTRQALAESCGACLRREQARRNLTKDLLVVSGYRPLHMNTSTLYACFLRQPLELTLKKDFQLLRCQDGNGNSRGLAGLGLDPYAVWGFEL
jgi:hypothetical protein